MKGQVQQHHGGRLWPLAVFLLVFVCVLLAAAVMEVSAKCDEMAGFARIVSRDLDETASGARIVLTTLAGYYQSVDSPDREVLTALSETVLQQNPYLHSLSYFQWVDADRREDFARQMQERGLSGFRIHLAEGGTANPHLLKGRSGFLPLVFEASLRSRDLTRHGIDLLEAASRGRALHYAVESAEPALLQKVEGLGLPPHAMSWIHATYRGRRVPEEISARYRRFDGIFMVTVDLERLVAHWQGLHPGYRIELSEGSGAAGERVASPRWAVEASPAKPLRLFHGIRLDTGENLLMERRLSVQELWPPGVLFIAALVGMLLMVFFLLWRSQRHQKRAASLARRALDRERERAQRTLHAIGDAVLVVDADWKIHYANPRGKQLLRRPMSEIRGRRLDEVITLQDTMSGRLVEDVRAYFISQSAEGERRAVRLVGRDGVSTAIDGRASSLTFCDGNDGMVIVMRDVSVEQELMERLAYQASHDMLTGLHNRSAFESWIKEALAESEARGTEHAMIYLDLDRFKLINDTCGHAAGDELLKRVAGNIREVLRSGDRLARVGGDEFGILLRECPLEVAEGIARRILVAIENFRFQCDEKLFQVHASIGVVPLGGEGGTLKEALMAADLACHVAKERGRNRIHVHAMEDVSVRRHHQEMQWLPRLQEALDHDRFVLFMQPIRPLDEQGGLPVMNEFLIRLRDHDGKLLPPGLFIPAAERYDLMWQIDRWMVENAIGYLREIGDTGEMLYTINLSAQTFGDRSFAEFVEMTLESYGVAAERICFELTETAAVTNISVAGELMQALKELGCRILLDDFGSGLSSFGYLKNLPIDYLKIDGQFVKDILSDPLDEVMVRMCRELALVLGVQTVAEFIESEEILEAVKAIGIDYGQGYHLGRPVQARSEGGPRRALG